MQTDTSFDTGNCGEACLASILEIELSDIPQLHDEKDVQNGHIYCKNLREFVGQFGLSYIDVGVIASGPSPRGTKDWHRHAVVWRNGKIIHDPHPSKAGLENIEMYGVFIELTPEKHNNRFHLTKKSK